MESLMIGGRWPNPKSAILPDNIYWENLSVGPKSRMIRKFISFVISLAILLGAILGILYMTVADKEFKAEFVEPISCPDGVTKFEAVQDQMEELGNGLIHCFCKAELIDSKNIDAMEMSFEDIEPWKSKEKWCEKWVFNYYGR